MYNCTTYGCDSLGEYLKEECENMLLGGMPAMLLLECNHQITDPSNATQINAALNNNTATLVDGASFTLEPPAAILVDPYIPCRTQRVVNYDRTALYKNQNVNPTNIDFHKTIFSGRSFGGIILFQCSVNAAGVNNVLWIDAAVSFQGGLIVPANNNEAQRFEGTISWRTMNDPDMYVAPAGIFN